MEGQVIKAARLPLGRGRAELGPLGVGRLRPDSTGLGGWWPEASLSSAGRWGFTTRFMYDAVVTRCQAPRVWRHGLLKAAEEVRRSYPDSPPAL